MTTRHLVSLVTGVLILSVLFPIGLSLWLAHRQVEKRFNEELDIFSSRVRYVQKGSVTRQKPR